MIVLKMGGGRDVNYDHICSDIARLCEDGEDLIVVHGGSHETNEISKKLDKPPRFVTSESGYESRYTDRETIDIFSMVYAGKINTNLTAHLQRLGVNAFGMSGVDGGIIRGERKDAIRVFEEGRRRVLRGGYTGRVTDVDAGALNGLMQAGYTPVISPPALSFEGDPINVDGDRMSAALAGSIDAGTLIILTDRPGLLRDPGDESSLVREIGPEDLDRCMSWAQGRMRIKVLAAREALAQNVSRVVFSDARVRSPVYAAMNGCGTTFFADTGKD